MGESGDCSLLAAATTSGRHPARRLRHAGPARNGHRADGRGPCFLGLPISRLAPVASP